MTLSKSHSNIFILSIAAFLLSISSAMPAGAPPADETDDTEEGNGSFKVTSHTAHNPFPSEILERMRAELMVVMGIEPEETEETDKKQNTGH